MQPGHATFYTNSSCDSPISLSSADSGQSSLLMSLESSSCKPFRAFRSTDQYLVAMKEDLADWLNQLYSLDINVENFITSLENGVLLCRHANNLMRKARSLGESGATVPKCFLVPSSAPSTSSVSRTHLKTSPSTSAISSATWSPVLDFNNSKLNRFTSNTPAIVKGEVADETTVTGAEAAAAAAAASVKKQTTLGVTPANAASVNGSVIKKKSLLPRSTSSFNNGHSLNSHRSSTCAMVNSKALINNNNSIARNGNSDKHGTRKNISTVNNNNNINYNNNIAVNNNYNKFNDESDFNSLTLRLASSSFRSSSTSTSSSSLSDHTVDTDDSANSKCTATDNHNTQMPSSNHVKSSASASCLNDTSSSSAAAASSPSFSSSSSSSRGTFQTVQATPAVVTDTQSSASLPRSPLTKSISNQNFKTPPPAFNRFAVKNNDDSSKSPHEINYWKSAKAQSFYARDNICSFLKFCRSIDIRECLLFECEDLVSVKNEKSVILCLLEVARKGAQLGMKIPLLIQMEQEIDKEIEEDEAAAARKENNVTRRNDDDCITHLSEEVDYHCHHKSHVNTSQANVNNDFDSQYNSETDSTDSSSMQQIVTNDLKSLHELVVDLLNRCTCPQQYPMIKVADGKYRIGDTKTLIFVRGWDTLEHYLDKHDPCRCYYSYNGRRKSTASLGLSRNRY